jgi:hypothetical protein
MNLKVNNEELFEPLGITLPLICDACELPITSLPFQWITIKDNDYFVHSDCGPHVIKAASEEETPSPLFILPDPELPTPLEDDNAPW